MSSPMSARARRAWPRATGHVARSRATGAPMTTTAAVFHKPSTDATHQTTPMVVDTRLNAPSTVRTTDQVRRSLYCRIATSFPRSCNRRRKRARVLHPKRMIGESVERPRSSGDAELLRSLNRLTPIRRTQLAVDRPQVRLEGVERDIEPLGDLCARQRRGQEASHF